MSIPRERPVVLKDLYSILARAIRVVVKDSPMGDARTLFESTDKKDLEDLQRSLLLDTPSESFHCMCLGSPALYLYDRGGEFVELTNHHGLSVRCSLWTSDVRVRDTEKWLSWFDHRGMPAPRQEVETMHAQRETAKRDWDRWWAAMPKAIALVWSEALRPFGAVDVGPLRAALERDLPDEKERILMLLEWFGSGAGPWSGFPSYETAAEELLLGYPTRSIVEAIQSSGNSPARTEGAARLFGGWSFRQQRPDGLKEVPDALKRVLWNHVKTTKDTDKLSRAAGAFAE
jgi:hypothetical protein